MCKCDLDVRNVCLFNFDVRDVCLFNFDVRNVSVQFGCEKCVCSVLM